MLTYRLVPAMLLFLYFKRKNQLRCQLDMVYSYILLHKIDPNKHERRQWYLEIVATWN